MRLAISFIGYGELARAWCGCLSSQQVQNLRAFVRRPTSTTPGAQMNSLVTAGTVQLCTDLGESIDGADVVIAAVPGVALVDVASRCAPILGERTIYVDVTSGAPDHKKAAAAAVSESGATYVDAAVMGTVQQYGLQMPIFASGTGAAQWEALFSGFGARITVLPGPAGDAARLKLVRSVYMKGRDALIVEMMVAAHRYGVEQEVIASIPPQAGAEAFDALVARVLTGLEKHSLRRADELAAAAEVLKQVGVHPTMTEAAAAQFRAFQRLGTDSEPAQPPAREFGDGPSASAVAGPPRCGI